jgi:hypothetical protein
MAKQQLTNFFRQPRDEGSVAGRDADRKGENGSLLNKRVPANQINGFASVLW